MAQSYPTLIPGLRSPSDQVNGLVYFGRMLDKIRLAAETLKGGSDTELLAWAYAHGRKPSDEEIETWNAFMTKRGWRDAGTQRLNERLAEIGLPPGTVQTMFEFIDLDEGRSKAS